MWLGRHHTHQHIPRVESVFLDASKNSQINKIVVALAILHLFDQINAITKLYQQRFHLITALFNVIKNSSNFHFALNLAKKQQVISFILKNLPLKWDHKFRIVRTNVFLLFLVGSNSSTNFCWRQKHELTLSTNSTRFVDRFWRHVDESFRTSASISVCSVPTNGFGVAFGNAIGTFINY